MKKESNLNFSLSHNFPIKLFQLFLFFPSQRWTKHFGVDPDKSKQQPVEEEELFLIRMNVI